MITELEVYIESDYTHENKFEATRQRIEKAAFYTQSLFKVIRLANGNFESISDDGDAKDAENYIEDLNNLCEIGSGLAFSVFREASNFSLYTFKEKGEKVEVSETEDKSFVVIKPINEESGDTLNISHFHSSSSDRIDILAAVISALIRNPFLPPPLCEKFKDALQDFFNDDIDQTGINEFHDSPEYILRILHSYKKEDEK